MSAEHDVDCPMKDEKQTDDNDEKVLENEESVVENGEAVVGNWEAVVGNGEAVVGNGEAVVETGKAVVETINVVVENSLEVVLNSGAVVGNSEAVEENGGPVVENGGPVVENCGPVVENCVPVLENGGPVVENGKHVVENEKLVVENAEDCPMTVETEEPSANTSKEDSAIDAMDKETLSSEVDEKKDVYGANERATLSWTAEGNEFKVAWSLPQGAATANDYIALCCTGKIFYSSKTSYQPVLITFVIQIPLNFLFSLALSAQSYLVSKAYL